MPTGLKHKLLPGKSALKMHQNTLRKNWIIFKVKLITATAVNTEAGIVPKA